MSRPLFHPALMLCALLALLPALPTAARADGLRDAFTALSEPDRKAVQRELARAELYLAEVDGSWSAATERALRRGVDTVALKTRNEVHPRIASIEEADDYIDGLRRGKYSKLLYERRSLWRELIAIGTGI